MHAFFRYLIVFALIFYSLPLIAQVIELGTKQDITISGASSLPFSGPSNTLLMTNFQTNPVVTLDISTLVGSPITVKPVADFVDAGPSIQISMIGTFSVDFSMASANVNTYSLFITPQFGPSVFSLTATSSMTAASSSSGGISSSSSSGGVSSSSSSGFLPGQTALSLEGPNQFFLKPTGTNQIKYIATAINFTGMSQCMVFTSIDALVKITPRTFVLSPSLDQQIIKIMIPSNLVNNLIKTITTKTLLFNVTCENDARNQVNIEIRP